jgi:soluble lytic murein transglycosylase
LKVFGQQCHGWLPALLLSAFLFLVVTPAVIRATPETAQLPVSLLQWNQLGTFPLTDALQTFKRGMELYFSERYAAALETLTDPQASKATALGDYVLLYRAKSELILERNRDALNDYRQLESRYPDSPLIREALLGQCQVLLALKEPKTALSILGNLQMSSNPEALFYQAKSLDMAGEKEKAAEAYLRIYSQYPTSKYSPMAEQYFTSSSPGAFKGARHYEARLRRAESLMASGDHRTARVILLALGKVAAPNKANSEKRSLLTGEVEYRLGRASSAIPYLRQVTAADPSLHAKSLYLEGVSARKLDREQDFLALRDRILKLYPRSPDAEELCYSVATHYDVNYGTAKSRAAYSVLYQAFPKGKYAERSLWKLALYPYFEKQYAEAAFGFWKYLVANPSPLSAASAMYWMGRCYQKLGDSESAKYLYGRARSLGNDSYYGQRAREAEASLERTAKSGHVFVSGIDFDQVTATCNGIQLPPAQLAEPDAAGIRTIGRARQLMLADLSDLALTELRLGRTRQPQNEAVLSYVMSRIYFNKMDYDAAIATLRRAVPDYSGRPIESLPVEFWDILFPIHHWGIIKEQARRLNVDPNLILGLIRQESAFDEKARSKANARGLMQILPSTGRLLSKGARLTRYNAAKLYEAETNIILGTRYLASFLQQYGKPELALAAYNAGDSRVERWQKEWRDLDMAEFVEQIPFAETRAYVKQVLSNNVRYGLLTSSAPTNR